MKTLAIVITMLVMTGCTAGTRMELASKADNVLETSEWVWCNAQSTGAEKRRYYGKPTWSHRLAICWPTLAAKPAD